MTKILCLASFMHASCRFISCSITMFREHAYASRVPTLIPQINSTNAHISYQSFLPERLSLNIIWRIYLFEPSCAKDCEQKRLDCDTQQLLNSYNNHTYSISKYTYYYLQ
jgi:hypothetical protein